MSSNYTHSNFIDLINIIAQEQDLRIVEHHECIYEFWLPNVEVALFRLLFHEQSGDIIISFHASASPSSSIQILEYIRGKFKLVKITEEYYVSQDGEVFVGQDAYASMEMEQEDSIVQNIENEDMMAEVDGLVTIVSNYPIYPAWDKKAWDEYKEFKKRKKNGF